ncbi:DUF397 domain-containing protein [Streptomyces sp. NPDC102467]|uniref:DUF397 domain-containing protein n=1 Tax=Streptomyces sp. NPDC102467 TaxID=3366179 RepID=UPI0037F39EC0
MLPSTDWHKSSRSNDHNVACVEVTRGHRAVQVRDSKDLARPPFTVAAGPWTAFVAGLGRDR